MSYMSKCKFSIIVPVYNVEKYIYRCLKSIYDQTYTDFEVIIVNDGTPDESANIIRKDCIFDERFNLFDKENGGLSSARNYGLKKATGEFVIFVDSDDWLLPTYLESVNTYLAQDIDILIADYWLADTNINKRYVPFQRDALCEIFQGEDKDKEILEKHLIAYPRTGYKIKNTIMPVWKNVYSMKLLLEKNLLFVSEREVMAEDYVFNCQAYFYAQKIMVIPEAGYVHETVMNSLSKKYRENGIEMTHKRSECVYEFIHNNASSRLDRLDEAIVTNFVFSITAGIRKLIISDETDKIKKTKQILQNEKVRAAFGYNNKYNLPFVEKICVRVVKTNNPYVIWGFFKVSEVARSCYQFLKFLEQSN